MEICRQRQILNLPDSADGRYRTAFSDEEQILRFVQSLITTAPNARPTAVQALADRIFVSIAANIDHKDNIPFDSVRHAMRSLPIMDLLAGTTRCPALKCATMGVAVDRQ